MPRPKQNRCVERPPMMEGFKPFGIPMHNLEPVVLLFEEYESIRLTDYEGMTQEQAAGQMKVSRPTFTRIYEKARRSIAQAFVEGKAIFFEGGNFHTDDFWYRCDRCHKVHIYQTMVKECCHCKSDTMRLLNNKPDNEMY